MAAHCREDEAPVLSTNVFVKNRRMCEHGSGDPAFGVSRTIEGAVTVSYAVISTSDRGGSVVHAPTISGTSPTAATYQAMSFWRGDRILWRATCLACGAALRTMPDGSTASSDAALVEWCTAFADQHDAAGCLPTFTTERASVGATLEALATRHLPSGARFLEELARIAIEGRAAQYVVVQSAEGLAASIDAALARHAALHTTDAHSALSALDYAVRDHAGPNAMCSAVTSAVPALRSDARRWWLFAPERTLVLESFVAPDGVTVQLTVGSETFQTSADGTPVAIEPFALILATQLGAL